MKKQELNMANPYHWKKLTSWEHKMVELQERCGNTEDIIAYLFWEIVIGEGAETDWYVERVVLPDFNQMRAGHRARKRNEGCSSGSDRV